MVCAISSRKQWSWSMSRSESLLAIVVFRSPYKPFWIEEPICPEHVDGCARIKEETGVTIAGGEH